MPTTRKSPARKTSAATKKTTTRTPRKQPEAQPKVVSEAQKQAMLEAYYALQSVQADIPKELADTVEGWVAELQAQRDAETQRLDAERQSQQNEIEQANQDGPWYVRNGYPAPFNLRLDRQTEKRRIQLKARGEPGDMHPLLEGDLKDPVLKQNLGLGLIEIIPAGEASIIIDKQTNNLGHRVHAPLQVLRNELNQPYQQGAVKVEAEFNSQGVTVAQVDPRVMQGQLDNRTLKNTGGIQRTTPGEVMQGGNQVVEPQQATSVIRSGFVPTGGNPAIVQYGPMGDNARASVVDDLARRKGLQGPGAGLGEVTVTVDPVVRT